MLDFIRLLHAIAGDVQFQNNAVMYYPIDDRSGCHRIFEYLLPFGEGKIAGDHHTAALIAFGQEGKKHFHLLLIVLNVADVINHDRIELIHFFKLLGQPQVFLGSQKLLNQKATFGKIEPSFFGKVRILL